MSIERNWTLCNSCDWLQVVAKLSINIGMAIPPATAVAGLLFFATLATAINSSVDQYSEHNHRSLQQSPHLPHHPRPDALLGARIAEEHADSTNATAAKGGPKGKPSMPPNWAIFPLESLK